MSKNSVRVDGQKYTQDFAQSGKYMTLGLNSLKANETKKSPIALLWGLMLLQAQAPTSHLQKVKNSLTGSIGSIAIR